MNNNELQLNNIFVTGRTNTIIYIWKYFIFDNAVES